LYERVELKLMFILSLCNHDHHLWSQVRMYDHMAIICYHEDISIHSNLKRKSWTSIFKKL
jgi:hypothetical protein